MAAAEPPKKRGRPSKSASATSAPGATNGKKRGRPGKGDTLAVSLDEEAPPKKRGRPPKGGETTKVDYLEEAAAEQLEDELVEAAAEEPIDEPSKPISSVKRGRGRPKKASAIAVADDMAVDEEDIKEATGKRYWLMKAEQEDREETLEDGTVFNARFTIDDLRDKGGPEPWDGESATMLRLLFCSDH